MPNPQRTINGQLAEWDGQGWLPVHQGDAPAGDPNLYHPGADESPLMATLKGFGKGAAAEATPLKMGALAALLSGGSSIPAQMLAAGGAQALSDTAQVAAGTENAPKSLGSAMGDVALAAGTSAIPGIAGKVYQGVSALKNAAPQIGSSMLNVAEHLPVVGKPLKVLRDEVPNVSNALRGLKSASAPKAAADDLFSAATADKPVAGFDWPEAGGRYEPDAIGSHKLAADPLADANATTGDFAGPRTTGHFEPVNALTGKPTGLAGITPDEMSNLGRASNAASDFDIPASWKPFLQKESWKPPYAQQPPMSLGEDIPLDLPESAPLTDAERLAARSQERFGKQYRSETTTR